MIAMRKVHVDLFALDCELMKVLLQKVSQASVCILDETTGEVDPAFPAQSIGAGYVLLVGCADTDGAAQVQWLAKKIKNLRVFEDEDGKMNLNIDAVGGSILSISQFTLFADTKKGNRPSFIRAGKPEHAERIWHDFNEELRQLGLEVKEGRFGAHMQVSLVNDGPVTIPFDTEELGIR